MLLLLKVTLFIACPSNNQCGWLRLLFHSSAENTAELLTLYLKVCSIHVNNTPLSFWEPRMKPNPVLFFWNSGSIFISSIGTTTSQFLSISCVNNDAFEQLNPEDFIDSVCHAFNETLVVSIHNDDSIDDHLLRDTRCLQVVYLVWYMTFTSWFHPPHHCVQIFYFSYWGWCHDFCFSKEVFQGSSYWSIFKRITIINECY